jgi:hypothetical protein
MAIAVLKRQTTAERCGIGESLQPSAGVVEIPRAA